MSRKNKYNNTKTEVDGIMFDSKAEARRYGELLLFERAGEIHNLTLQPRFNIVVNGVGCGFYKADFAYFTPDERMIEDVKGIATAVYKLKKKLVEAQYGIKITEIKYK